MAKQLNLKCSWGLRLQTPGGGFAARMKLGAPPPDPGGGFAARMKLGAPPPDPRWGSAPDPGGFAARM